jgi:deoxycytidylate deaminase
MNMAQSVPGPVATRLVQTCPCSLAAATVSSWAIDPSCRVRGPTWASYGLGRLRSWDLCGEQASTAYHRRSPMSHRQVSCDLVRTERAASCGMGTFL